MGVKGQSKYEPRSCLTCDKPLTSQQIRRGNKYCSLECRQVTGRPPRIGRQIDYICKYCGNHFQDRKHGERQGRTYCSLKCRSLGRPSFGKMSEGGPGNRIFMDHNGYVVFHTNGYRDLQHRMVMETMIGRKLEKGETVHHKNGIRHDNRPENLELWSKSHPPGQRVSDLLNLSACGASIGILSLSH